ncbi:MAG: hydrolase TatD [Phototrophicales bacterium]|nr:MAG: hydrolase TatD [Phototrophicales bacterium]
MIDTHCHLNFHQFDADRAAVVERAARAGVARILIPAVDADSASQAVALAAEYSSVFASVGIHPNDTTDFSDSTLDPIRDLAATPKVVAVGEIGLDYHWDKSPKESQWRAFEAQLALARDLEMPVIIHNREASEDVIAILETWSRDLPPTLRERPGVLHSFSAPQSIADRALACGFYLGFTGPITYKNADDLRQIAATMPLDRLLIETDAPYLSPVPYRGQRNEPAYVRLVAERIAALRRLPFDEIASATTANAAQLFQLPK